MPTHDSVIRYLVKNNSYAQDYVVYFIDRIKGVDIQEMLDEYPSDILSDGKKEIIAAFLREKLNRLNYIRMEESHGKG